MSSIGEKLEIMIKESRFLRSIIMMLILMLAIFLGFIYILSCTVR